MNKVLIIKTSGKTTSLGSAPLAIPLGRRAFHGLVAMLAQNVFARACGFLSQLLLAALLSPRDFGLIGLTYTVTSVTQVLLNVGISDVLLQRRQGLRLWTGPAFWIGLGLATAGGMVVVLIAPVMAIVYKAPPIVGLLAVLALSMPIGALASVPSMIMRARMQFGVVAAYGAIEMVAQAVLTVGFAWGGFGVYSFVLPAPILAAARSIVMWRLAASKVDLRPQLKRWKYVIGRTGVNFANRLIIAVIGQGDYIMLGLLSTQDRVGSYYFGFRLAAQPLWMLAGNFQGVLYPALVQLKNDPARQNSAVIKASTLLSFCIMPMALIQAAIAAPLVSSLFGHKWQSSIPVIQLLSIGLGLDAVSWVAGCLLNARGEFVVGLKYLLFQAPVFFLLVTIGAYLDQAVGTAWGVAIYYATTQPMFVWGVFRRIGISTRQVVSIYVVPTMLSIVAVGLGLAVSMLPVLSSFPLVRIGVIGAVAVAVYGAFLKWVAPDVWAEISSRLLGGLRKVAA